MDHFAEAVKYIQSLEARVKDLELAAQAKDAEIARLSGTGVKTRAAAEVPSAELASLLTKLNAEFSRPEVQQEAKRIAAEVAPTEEGEDEQVRNKLRAVNEYVIGLQRDFFLQHGQVEDGFELLHSHHHEFPEELEELVEEFRENEERVVVVAALGQEIYDRNQREESEILAIQEEIETIWDTGDMDAKQELVTSIRAKAQVVFTNQLNKAKSQAEMMRIYETLNAEDRHTMMRAEVLQRVIGARQQQHGHSHGGQPCHGHGEQEQEHGHSHGGQPCHGHGGHDDDEEDEEEHAHSHSHGGQPCHGHGGHEEESESEEDEAPAHSHSHSHGGKACHGHGH
ncbi:hypothetical protein BASA81_006814 [Batrachochytrium salamandrivorans]|nr:hypothetical protein BASA81_006814 [Batrachochytrium salamandrivorans]